MQLEFGSRLVAHSFQALGVGGCAWLVFGQANPMPVAPPGSTFAAVALGLFSLIGSGFSILSYQRDKQRQAQADREIRDLAARQLQQKIDDQANAIRNLEGEARDARDTAAQVRKNGQVIAATQKELQGKGLLEPDVGDLDAIPPAPARPEPPVEPARLLVVERDLPGLRALSGLLRRKGYEIDEAATSDEAIRRLGGGPGAILLDLAVPGPAAGDPPAGLAVLAEVRRRGLTCPVVMTSGSDDPATTAAVAALKPDQYLLKPINMQSLLTYLQSLSGAAAKR